MRQCSTFHPSMPCSACLPLPFPIPRPASPVCAVSFAVIVEVCRQKFAWNAKSNWSRPFGNIATVHTAHLGRQQEKEEHEKGAGSCLGWTVRHHASRSVGPAGWRAEAATAFFLALAVAIFYESGLRRSVCYWYANGKCHWRGRQEGEEGRGGEQGRAHRRQQSLHLTAVLCSVRKWLNRATVGHSTSCSLSISLSPPSLSSSPSPSMRSGGDICRRQTCEILSRKFCAGRAPFIMRPPPGRGNARAADSCGGQHIGNQNVDMQQATFFN